MSTTTTTSPAAQRAPRDPEVAGREPEITEGRELSTGACCPVFPEARYCFGEQCRFWSRARKLCVYRSWKQRQRLLTRERRRGARYRPQYHMPDFSSFDVRVLDFD